MPSYRGHLIGGIAAFTIAASIPPLSYMSGHVSLITFLSGLAACLTGALFPDIDTNSMGRKYFYIAIFAALIVAILQQSLQLIFFFSVLGFFPLLTPHRGMTHNPIFLCVAPLMIIRIATPDAPWLTAVKLYHYIFFVAGALSHIILDFFPFKKLFRTVSRKMKKARWH